MKATWWVAFLVFAIVLQLCYAYQFYFENESGAAWNACMYALLSITQSQQYAF